MFIVLIIFLILFVIILMNLLRYILIVKPNKVYRDDIQSKIDEVVDDIILELIKVYPELKINKNNLTCKSLDDIWKKRIMVFEYYLKIDSDSINSEELKNYIKKMVFEKTKNDSVKMAVTDFWINKNKINFDIAYLINEKTKNYVSDIRKTE
ncbi:hypothetical protein GSH19_01710 [Lactobacillus sp. S2-2]|uniref:hypothetical protein n=1 Tax=Lactobacillus sp. S2-2 TaxID=2692917 RepID=UPI001F29D5E8|nr:hypothetical protein [Lactobacillus sp. S2-2]MCF6514879.1 hypothetical protein [Lactobacillus sp. S2-2]